VNGTRIIATARRSYGERIVASMGEQRITAGITVEDVRRQYAQTASYGMWITEVQLDPPQLIVCDDAGTLYRVPVTIKGGAITFGDPVEVKAEFVDVMSANFAGKIAASAARHHAEVQQTRRIIASRYGHPAQQQTGGSTMPGTKQKRRISPELARQAGQALTAARGRRALTSDRRAAFWAEQVITAGSDEAAREVIGTIDSLHGLDGPGPGAGPGDGDDLGEFAGLWPPGTLGEARRRAGQRAMIAAAYDDGDDDDEGEFLHLWPPQRGQEAAWQAARDAADREAIAASARQQAEEDEDFAALFPGEPER
jgi:hypothetical protein